MMKKFYLLVLIALVVMIAHPVLAVNLTFTNLGTGKLDLMFYSPNGTLEGIYNTSSPVVPLAGDHDVQIVVRPNTASSWINNPLLLFTDLTGFLMTNFAVIFVILCMVAIGASLAAYGRRY